MSEQFKPWPTPPAEAVELALLVLRRLTDARIRYGPETDNFTVLLNPADVKMLGAGADDELCGGRIEPNPQISVGDAELRWFRKVLDVSRGPSC